MPTQNGVLKKDDNGYPVMGGTSNADNETIVNSAFDVSTRRLLTSTLATTSGSATAQTTTVADVTHVTVGASDATYLIMGAILCTAYTSGNLNFQVNYKDASNTDTTVSLQGHFTSGYSVNVSGTGDFEVQALSIRAKAGTTITLKTAGTFNLTYNVYGTIMQIA